MNEVISIRYGWNIIAWTKSHPSRTLISKIYWVSKSIPAARSQKFVNISGAQKPTWAKFLEFEFFLPEKTRLHRYYQDKNNL